MNTAALPIPTFLPAKQHGNAAGRRLVAAVRYDYEVALLAPADIVRKYADLMSKSTVYEVLNYTCQPEVRAAQCSVVWLLKQKEKQS